MKKTNLLLVLLISLSFTALAKGPGKFSDGGADIPANVVKLNLWGLAFKSFSFQYERVLGNKTSVCGGLRFSPFSNLAGRFNGGLSSGQNLAGDITSVKYGNWAITPEFRYYLSKQAGKGFYLAPFLRYESFGLKSSFLLKDGGANVADFKGSLGGLGAGLMTGAQFSLGEKISLDWWIAGGYMKFHTLKMSATSADFGLSSADLAEINDEIKTIDNALLKNFEASATNQEISLKAKSSFPGVRAGLCLGFRF